MLDKEEIDKILSCDNCPTSYACEGCDINYNDKQRIKKYIQELEESNKQLDIENNRLEKIEFEKDMADKVIEEMAETICIYRGYAITKLEDIQKLKDRVIQEYFEKKGKVNE